MEMQEPQGYAQTQFSEERKQRVSQAKKRYNCYTERISYKERTQRATKSGSHKYASGHTHIPCEATHFNSAALKPTWP